MNTRHARMILAIVREGSFTAAAKALSITQPTLSQTVRQIEAQLGDPIFVRGKTPVALTPAGALYVEAARRFVQTQTQLEEALSLLHGKAKGTLRIGLMRHRSAELLPQVISDFYAAYPDVHLVVSERDIPDLEQMLLRGELDMALITDNKQHPRLEYRQIASEEIVLLAGKRTALAARLPSGSTIGLREAADERFVMPAQDSPRLKYFDDLLLSCNVQPKVFLQCDSIGTGMRACASADLVMLCPFIAFLCDSASMHRLSHYHLGTDAYLPPFYMAHAKDAPLAPYAEALYTMLSNRFRAMTAYRP
ncbi:MAG: LysR family transcriptional regulator [Clostridiales bacterium]|nr:LysR family transcriptional regulator [Clostridiales bacterium]